MTITRSAEAAMLAGALALCATAAQAQQQNVRVITKTLVGNSAHKECVSVSDRQTLRWWYRADALIDFRLHGAADSNTDLRKERQALGSGSFSPRAGGDYCLVWTNAGKKPLLFRVEIARLAR